MTPKTLEEWTAYVEKLSGAELRSKAMAANSLDFMRQLEAEGTPPQEVMKILKVFAKRFAATGQEVPSRYEGALVDYEHLLNPVSLPASEGISMDALAHRVATRFKNADGVEEFLKKNVKTISDIAHGMSANAGGSFGMRDVREALDDWFHGAPEPKTDKQKGARGFLESDKGKKLLKKLTEGITQALRDSGKKPGYRDIGEALVKFLAQA